jgi:microsomal dipeptidase-like Zn-dependent dipeptidase
MRMRLLTVIAAFATLAISGCVTQPKPCTAEWVDWKSDRLFDEFARDHRKQIDDLRDATSNLDPSGERTPAHVSALALTGIRTLALGADFFTVVVPEVKKAVSQCATTPKATQLFASLLRREGFSPETVKAIEDLGVFLDRND